MLVVLKDSYNSIAVEHTQVKSIDENTYWGFIRGVYPSTSYKATYVNDVGVIENKELSNDSYTDVEAILKRLCGKNWKTNVYKNSTSKGQVYASGILTEFNWNKEQNSPDIDISAIQKAIPQLTGKEYQVKKYYSDKIQKDVVEIDTPFTDALSDGIGVYIIKEDKDTYKITDDGWTYWTLNTFVNMRTKKLAENQLIDIPDNKDIKLYNDGDEIAATCDKDGLQEAFNLVLTTIIKISIQAVEQSKKLD